MIPTLRQRVTQISIGAFVITSAVMLLCFIFYSVKKNSLAKQEVELELKRNIVQQIEQLIPSFLLPEQRSGVELLLARIQQKENLSNIKVIENEDQIPKDFLDCKLSKNLSTVCTNTTDRVTAVISPIIESDHNFGYLFKAKTNSSSWAIKNILQLVGVFAIMLGLTFLIIYIFTTRVLSKTLPESLDRLVEWIEADLNGGRTDKFQLPFKELEDLKGKISEVMERHNRSRDQAVIGQLTSGIMHDIKTPLQSIVTALHLVEEQEHGSKKRLSRLENLNLMCKNNLPLIGQIIETTLDGNRQISIEKRSNDLRVTLEKAIHLNKEMSSIRKVPIEVEAPNSIIVPHDNLQFGRVINNLVKNAIEAASDSSNPKKVKVTLTEKDNSTIQLLIEDSGSGISGPIDRIFRAFRTSKVRGTGLGLLISKKIVEAHQGNITASNLSVLGGARMEVILPKSAEEVSL